MITYFTENPQQETAFYFTFKSEKTKKLEFWWGFIVMSNLKTTLISDNQQI